MIEDENKKEVVYYQALLDSWVQTNIERDKTIIALSAGGIGLLVTLLTTVGVIGYLKIICVLGSFLGFTVAILIGINIFEQNGKHVENVLKGIKDKNSKLEINDRWLKVSFRFALGCMIALGLLTMFNFDFGGENKMMKEKIVIEKTTLKTHSLAGIQNLAPSDIGKSLQGIERLAPQQVQLESCSSSSESAQTTSATDSSK